MGFPTRWAFLKKCLNCSACPLKGHGASVLSSTQTRCLKCNARMTQLISELSTWELEHVLVDFSEFGVPCRHVCAALFSVKQNPISFVCPERRLEALQLTYLGGTIPVDVCSLIDVGMKPPMETKRRGRPKEKRYVSSTEKKPRKKVTCGICGGLGHNKRTCKKMLN